MSASTTRDDAALALLCQRWPKCFFMFQGGRLPLKIGIHKDIPDGLIEPKVLRLAFRLYVNNPGYLNAMRLGVARVDLNGEVAGTVGENDAKSAQARLNGIRKFRKNRKQPRREKAAQDVVAAPPPAPSPSPPPPPRRQQPSQRDSLASLREAARKRRGAA
jgi:ProP effector